MDLSTILVIVAAALAGLVVALRRIAPKTATLKDDALLAMAEPASEALDKLTAPKAPKTDA